MKAHPDQRWGNISYAQHGDDFMIINLFEMLGIDKPSYIDLGAHDPEIISNTALLYQRGCRGINVEANPNLIERFRKERPQDKNLNVGVSNRNGKATFYMYSDKSGRNTFSYEEVESLKGVMTLKSTCELKIMHVNEIINMFWMGMWPNFLSIDLEGLDYEVIEAMDFSKTAPKVICVEVRKGQGDKFRRLLSTKGFEIYCRMGENLFFVDKNLIWKCY